MNQSDNELLDYSEDEKPPRNIIVKLESSFAYVGAKKARTRSLTCMLPEHEARKIFQMVEVIIASARRDSK